MTPAQRARVRDLFEQAFELPDGSDLRGWITREAGDPVVADELLSLLNYHSQAGSFLDAPLTEHTPGLLDHDEARFQPGDVVGAYRIKRELGRGGMGYVYLATDTKLDRDVALKALASPLLHDASQRERLRREARAAALLSHPGICTIYALEEIGREFIIVAEYVDGRTLRDEISSGRRPSGSDLLQAVRELAAALAAAHARGITHRDLKPENVMRSANGSLKILDFGLALMDVGTDSSGSPRVTSPGTIVGTPAYMAPEQINHGVVDARTDLFALGVLLFEYATGVHPFEAASPMGVWARVLEGRATEMNTLRQDLPPQIELIVQRCLQKNPVDRFATAGEVIAVLAQDPVRRRVDGTRAFWWRTHLKVVLALYVIAAVASWFVNEWQHGLGGPTFALVAMLATIGGMFRSHLLFAEREHDAATFRRELGRASLPLSGVDLTMAAALIVEGLWVSPVRPIRGALISGLGLGIALTRLVLERSTTQAAFEETPSAK